MSPLFRATRATTSHLVHAAVANALGATFAAALAGQCPPGAPMPRDVMSQLAIADHGAAHVRWTTAQDALQSGDLDAARRHLLAALEFHPASPALLFALAFAWRSDKDQAPLWAERFVRAAADAQGRLKLEPAWRKLADTHKGFEATLKPGADLAMLRAAAIVELARFVDSKKPAAKHNMARAVLVRWAAELLLEVSLGAPAQLAAVADAVAKVQDGFAPDHELVCQALLRVLQRKPAATPTTGVATDAAKLADQRVRAARILVGLQRQAAFKDLKGPPPPDVSRFAEEAQRVLDEHAATVVAADKVWTIAELEALTPPEAERFTEQHRDWHHPGVALSPASRYRVETICGHHTLLQTCKTIELHHDRLISHYGIDPFLQRQGLVRIVPEASDLETEGVPYWWAGGFQSGDRTTVRFAWNNIPSLGRTLTHELTHRFDGVLRPFLGGWYGEGHAQWTAGHYAKMTDKQFVDSHLDVGTPAHTWSKGYGGRAKFEQLLAGKVEDYRDNYFAGYSLYAFLRSYPPQAPRYRDVLEKFEKNARGGQKDPVAYFTSTFCDGKQGRPKTFDELFADWETFLRDCYDATDPRKKKAAWLAGYQGIGKGETSAMVMDAPTWSWARKRAEPFFGQDHAAAATMLLHEVGDGDATIAAGLWSTTVDGWRPETARATLAALRAGKAQDAAAAFATVAQRHFPDVPSADSAPLCAAAPKTKVLLDALAARAASLAPESPGASVAVVEDHARLASLLGLPRLAAAPTAPLQPLPGHLGGHGFTESSLTDYDDRRVAGLWYATADGDLHVGREKPRENTGTLDREAHQRDAFVHTVAWQAPGQYVLRGRVHLTTSFASGAIVFGHTRRDRQLRLSFSSGDYDYATGRSEQNSRSGTVNFHLRGLWERDGNLPETSPTDSVAVTPETPWFDYALHVRGPRVLVEINGEALLRYSVHDGSPIEGHVGFAMSMGAIRVQLPTVQRIEGQQAELMSGLDLAKQPGGSLEDLLLLPTRGVPAHADGTLVLWLPLVTDGSPADMLPMSLPVLAKMLQTAHEHPQPWVLAVPKSMPAADRQKAIALIQDLRRDPRHGPLPVIEHVVHAPFTGDDPWLLFVDGQGVLRGAAATNEPRLHTIVARWSRMFRSR